MTPSCATRCARPSTLCQHRRLVARWAGLGTTIVAVVLNLPMVGPLMLGALISQDMYLAGSLILMLSVLTVVGTLISDILLAWLDPRIRLSLRD